MAALEIPEESKKVISIILPVFNTQRYIQARIDSILNQTYKDWECIVIDGFSIDGSWEKLIKVAGSDKRFQLFQFPPKGPYDAWNKGIVKSKGDYIYIATSDDTMAHDCLEKLVAGLEEHSDCGLAHCNLTIIDEEGNDLNNRGWDWARFPPGQYFGSWYSKKHKRIAPHDAVLYGSLHTIYHSITQLLIRRNLFEKTGLFRTDMGSSADFEWGMRAAFLTNTVHVPEYLATWRVHSQQGTQADFWNSSKHRKQLIEMVKSAHQSKRYNKICLNDLLKVYQQEEWAFLLNEKKYVGFLFSFARSLMYDLSYLLNLYSLFRYQSIIKDRPLGYIKKMKNKYGLEKLLLEL